MTSQFPKRKLKSNFKKCFSASSQEHNPSSPKTFSPSSQEISHFPKTLFDEAMETGIVAGLNDIIELRAKKVPRSDNCGRLLKRADKLKRRVLRAKDIRYYRQPLDAVLPDVSATINFIATTVRNCCAGMFSVCDCETALNKLKEEGKKLKWINRVLINGRNSYPKLQEGTLPKMPDIPSGIRNDKGTAWFHISLLYGGCQYQAAKYLLEYGVSKRVLVQEGAMIGLLRMMKLPNYVKCRIVAIKTLVSLSGDEYRARMVWEGGCVGIIKKTLEMSWSRRELVAVTELVHIISEFYHPSKQDFGDQRVTHLLIKMVYDIRPSRPSALQKSRSSSSLLDSSYDMDTERIKMRVTAAGCLALLTRNCEKNCEIVSDTVGLLKVSEFTKEGNLQLQLSCLQILRNIGELAAVNDLFKNHVFAPENEAATKVIIELTGLIHPAALEKLSRSGEIAFLTLAIETLGFLSQVFTATNNGDMAMHLLQHITHADLDVKRETFKTLEKLLSPLNHVRQFYGERMLECGAVSSLGSLIAQSDGEIKKMAIKVLCRICLVNVSKSIISPYANEIVSTLLHVDAHDPELVGLVVEATDTLFP